MSVERDLLGRWHNGDLLPEEYMKLMKETKELLAQPEHIVDVTDRVEQEPVGYLYKQMECTGEWATIFKVDKPYITWHDIKDIVPVYTSPQKREPLSDKEIHAYLSLMEPPFLWDEGFCSGIEWAEQQHGIGGGE